MATKEKRFDSSYYEGPKEAPMYEPVGYTVNGNKLSALAEEMLFAAAHYYNNPDYWPRIESNGNFWSCLKPELNFKANWPEDFTAVLTQMKADQEAKKAEKVARKAAAKSDPTLQQLIKNEEETAAKVKEADKAKYGYAIVDGESVPLDGYQIESPSIIITRGADPRIGLWKYRVTNKDVTLNIVGNKKPTNWSGKIESSNTSEWMFKYKVQLGRPNGKHSMVLNKKVCIGATTALRQKNTENKFDKNRVVLQNWNKIKELIQSGLKSSNKVELEHATCAWLMQMTGIRVGNPRDLSKFADTKGATTLLGSNMELKDGSLKVSFLGKDSVPFKATLDLDTPELKTAFEKLLSGVNPKDYIFPDVDSGSLKNYLEQVCKGITCKGMRTAKCNEVFAKVLQSSNVTKNSSEADKLKVIFQANLEVAKKLNHQKNVSKNYKAGEDKSKERVQKAKDSNSELKAKLELAAKKIKIDKANLNKKLKAGKITKSQYDEKLEALNKKAKNNAERLEKSAARIEKATFNLEKKQETKDISLGTSLNNYVDLELLCSFLEDIELPIEKIFTASQLKKMDWCKGADKNLWKNYPN